MTTAKTPGDVIGTLTDAFIARPRVFFELMAVFIFLVWQSVVFAVGLFFYILFQKIFKVKRKYFLPACFFPLFIFVLAVPFSQSNPLNIIYYGFLLNIEFWKSIFEGFAYGFSFSDKLQGIFSGFLLVWKSNYLIPFPLLVSAVFSVIDLIPDVAHEKTIKALQSGQEYGKVFEVDSSKIDEKLKSLDDEKYDGTLLGVSKYSGNPVVMPDKYVNQVVLVLGTTGAGKKVTLRRFYKRAIYSGYPLIIVDGKPVDENINFVMNLAAKYGREFYGFHCGKYSHYDAFSNGGYTELKDKIISLKDHWESDYYRSIAEAYLQTTFEVLIKLGKPFDINTVADCLTFENLALKVRATNDEKLMSRVKTLERYDQKEIKGLQAHLSILAHSELGEYFEHKKVGVEENQNKFDIFNLSTVIENNSVVYFALPALRFPSFSSVLGKLVVNDIKAVIDRQKTFKPIFTIFDEFSVFAGDQVLNLINMGRGKGVHTVLGTQGLADLKKVDDVFERQVLNCANTLLCHGINDQESAEAVSGWVGTEDVFDVTAQVNINDASSRLGSVKKNRAFIIHPDEIKQETKQGEAFYITKVGGFTKDKIKVKLSS